MSDLPPGTIVHPLAGLPLVPGIDRAAFEGELQERARRLASTERADALDAELALLLTLGGERFALPLARLREVRRAVPLTRLPGLSPHVVGLVSRRGRAYAVLDLARRLDLGVASPAERLVLIEARGGDFYVLAGDDVETASVPTLLAPPVAGWSSLRRGACRGVAPGPVTVLDPDRLLNPGDHPC